VVVVWGGECFFVDDVGSVEAAKSVRHDGKFQVVRVANARCGHIKLSVREARCVEAHTYTLEGLALGLIYCHGKRQSHRELWCKQRLL
jgi:hypothetical protein